MLQEIKKGFKDKADLIRTINPEMSPEQAVANVSLFNELEFNKTQIPVMEKRDEQLRNAGYEPNEWVYYECSVPINKDRTAEEQMKSYSRYFPKGVEFLMIQGAYTGGVIEASSRAFKAFSASEYGFSATRYTTFIRVRPNLIKN